jgi:hypothetical protein
VTARPSPEPDPRQGSSPGDVMRQLSRPVPAPDLTAPVMSRLGLGRGSARAARRRRIRRAGARLALVVVAVGASALCVQWHRMGVSASRSAAPTIPAAVRHDLDHHGQIIDRAIRCIQDLSPWRPPPSPVLPAPTPPESEETTEEAPVPSAQAAAPRWV